MRCRLPCVSDERNHVVFQVKQHGAVALLLVQSLYYELFQVRTRRVRVARLETRVARKSRRVVGNGRALGAVLAQPLPPQASNLKANEEWP